MEQIRLDTITIPKVKLTKEGFLEGEAILTRTGVFKYTNYDGSTRYELRHPDDVFNQDSLSTLKLIPITDDHPSNLVNSTNSKGISIGMTGENIRVDKDFVISSLKIIDASAVSKIKSKTKKELSLGYNLDLIEESGLYNGEKYTHRQTNIRYNHLSLVDKGRAGSMASIRIDGKDLWCQDFNKEKEEGVKMDSDIKELTYRIDMLEKDYEKERKIARELHEKNNELQINLDKAIALSDQQKIEIEKLNAERLDSIVDERVAKKIDLLVKASKFVNLDDLLGKSEREIMEKVIVLHGCKTDLSARSDHYIEARFDTILESTNKGDPEAIKRQVEAVKIAGENNVVKKTALDCLIDYQKEANKMR